MSKEREHLYLHEIAKRSRNLNKKMGKYVLEVYDVLEVIVKEYMERKRNDQTRNPSLISILIEHFTAIFWSLKLHLKFHRDATSTSEDDAEADKKLKDVARWELVCLTADDMNEDPEEKNVIDPGSKILEIISRHIRELFNIHAEDS